MDIEPSQGAMVPRRAKTMPIRQPLLVTLPVEFLEKNTDLVPDDMEYDIALKRYKYREKGNDNAHVNASHLVAQQEKTKNAIKAYEARTKEEFKSRWEVDTNGSWDWNTVIKDVENAKTTYNQLAERNKDDSKLQNCAKVIRKCFRKFCDYSPSVKAWLVLVPSGDYGAIVCGALGLIFKAAAKLKEVREDLLSFVGKIPKTIAMIDSYGKIYENEAELHQRILEFHISMLVALEHALSYFNERTPSKLLKAMGKQDEYGKKLQSKFEAFYSTVESLKEESTLCLHQAVKDGKDEIHKLRLESMESKSEIKREIKSEVSRLGDTMTENLVNRFKEILEANPKLSRLEILPKKSKITELDTDSSDRELAFAPRRCIKPRAAAPQVVELEDLIEQIGDNYLAFTETSISEALAIVHRLDFQEQDRTEEITGSTALHQLLASENSDILLIQGHAPTAEPLSATSLAAASLIFSLQKLQIPVLHFFCGQHKMPSANDEFLGPYGLMKALLQQFLAIYPWDELPFLDHSAPKHALRDIQHMGKLFRKLASNSLPETMTFIIIEGVNFFENSTWEIETREAIHQLMALVDNANSCVKLLFLCPTRSMYLPAILKEAELRGDNWSGVVDVPEHLLQGRRQGVRPQVLEKALSDSLILGVDP
ncbi:hypothetical protein G7Y89_g7571 [Cudoniella acicularis]|uniref:Uncharacterized protein n=1 Tax=Cudoniella acicularis TaxID=354080 RepID=A0A8H4W1U4_9HELO|nr:hypothetical protein G7Y89_g7571 [Cudoniella acicularis]